MQPSEKVRHGNPEQNYQYQMDNSLMRREAESIAGNGNVYDGARDERGFRNGKGTFTFSDGSVYDGEWQ